MTGSKLGEGAFSEVFTAVKIRDQEAPKMAVKVFKKHKLAKDDIESLHTEIRLLDKIDHPHIIKFTDAYEDKNHFYVVTELVTGGELFDRLSQRRVYNEYEACKTVKVILETMDYLHGIGIVHRDLKPENLLLTSMEDNSDLKIADFGFAKEIKDLKDQETICGTPQYIAPEILLQEKYGTAVDIWSVGVITYVLLGGYAPFFDWDTKKMFKKIKNGKFTFHKAYWSNISDEAKDLIKKMLEKNQKKRWTARQLLEHEWLNQKEENLRERDLQETLVVFKKFNAKRRLRAAADAVIMANRMKKLMGGSGKNNLNLQPVGRRAMSNIDMNLLQQSDSVNIEENENDEDDPVALLSKDEPEEVIPA